MANEIVIVVKSRNEAKPGLDAAKADVERLTASQKEADAALRLLSADFNKVGDGASRFGRTLTDDGNFAKFTEERLGTLRTEARRLGEEFNRTGNVDVMKKLRDNQSTQDAIAKIRKDLAAAFDDGSKQGAQALTKNTAAAGAALTMPLAGWITAGVVAALPAINGLLMSTAALGGIGLGIAGQLKSFQVHSAFQDMAHDLMTTLSTATSSFEAPIVGGLRSLTTDLRQVIKSIDFTSLSQGLAPLVSGIGGLFRNMMPGFNDMLRVGLPILEEFARMLPDIGRAISDMFHMMSMGGKGAEEELRSIVMILLAIIETVGGIILVFSKAYEWIVQMAGGFAYMGETLAKALHNPLLEKFFTLLEGLVRTVADGTPHIEGMGRAFADAGGEALTAAGNVGLLADQVGDIFTESEQTAKAVQNLFSKMMGVDQGTLHWHESLTSLHDTLAKNGTQIDRHTGLITENTKKGQENVAAILAAVSANMALYQAQVASGIGADDAAKAYDANEQALERQLRAQGLSQQAIDGIIGKYRGLPDSMSPATRALQNMTDAVNRLVDALGVIFHLPSHKDFSINVVMTGLGGSALGSLAGQIAGIVGHHASGGVWGGLTTLAEQGSELVKLPQGSMVLSGADTQRQLASMPPPAGGSDGGAAQVQLVLDGSVLGTVLMRGLRTGQWYVPASAVTSS